MKDKIVELAKFKKEELVRFKKNNNEYKDFCKLVQDYIEDLEDTIQEFSERNINETCCKLEYERLQKDYKYSIIYRDVFIKICKDLEKVAVNLLNLDIIDACKNSTKINFENGEIETLFSIKDNNSKSGRIHKKYKTNLYQLQEDVSKIKIEAKEIYKVICEPYTFLIEKIKCNKNMVIDKNIDKAIKEVYNILENHNCYLTVIYKDLWLYIKINFKDDKISKIELKSYSQSMKNKDEYDITSINNLFNNIKKYFMEE